MTLAYKTVLFYDLNGKFLYSHKLKFIAANIAIKNDDEVFLFQNYFLDKNNFVKYHIVKTDLKFQKFHDFFPTYKKEFHNFYRFRSFDNTLLLSAPLFYSNKIFEVSGKNYNQYAKFNFIDKKIPDEFLELSIHSSQKDEYPILRNTIFKEDLVYFLFTYKGYYGKTLLFDVLEQINQIGDTHLGFIHSYLLKDHVYPFRRQRNLLQNLLHKVVERYRYIDDFTRTKRA